MATYYIDYNNGSDTNNGTSPSTAFKYCPGDVFASNTSAGTTLNPGDNVIFKGGVIHYSGGIICFTGVNYDGNSAGTFGNGIAILNGTQAINTQQLTVFYVLAFQVNICTNVTFNNLYITQWGGHRGNITWVGNFTQYTAQGIYITKSTNITIKNCNFIDIGDSVNQPYLGGASTSGSVNLTSCGVGVFYQSNNITITNCEFSMIHTGVSVQGEAGVFSSNGIIENVTIKNNSFHDYLIWGVDIACNTTGCTINSITIDGNQFYTFYQYNSNLWLGLQDIDGTITGNSYVTGAMGTSTFGLSELVVQSGTNAQGFAGRIQSGGNVLTISTLVGAPNSSNPWVGQTSGAIFNPILNPSTSNYVPHNDMIIFRLGGSPLPLASQILGTPANPNIIRNNKFYNDYGGTLMSGGHLIKASYTIISTGTNPGGTDFTQIGAANNLTGTVFTATGQGSGNGTAITFSQGGTAAVFLTTWGGTTYIYNNIFANVVAAGEGGIYCQDGPCTGNPPPDYWFINNSFFDGNTYNIFARTSSSDSSLTGSKQASFGLFQNGNNNGTCRVLNNIFYKTNGDGHYSLVWGEGTGDIFSLPTQLDYNVYVTFRADNVLANMLFGNPQAVSSFPTFNTLQASGYETHGQQISGLALNNLYANTNFGLQPNVSKNDLRPLLGGASINSGLNIWQLTGMFNTDILGNPRSLTGPWTCGAYNCIIQNSNPQSNLEGTINTLIRR